MADRGGTKAGSEPGVADPLRGGAPEKFEITYSGHFDGGRAIIGEITTNAGNSAAFGAITEAVFTLTAANLPTAGPNSA